MFAGEAFLQVARHCSSIRDESTAGSRSAISRAYYAVFWCSREYCESKLHVAFPPRRSVHHDIVREIRKARGDQFADRIVELHRLRKDADYFANYQSVDDDVQFVLDEALEIIRELKA